MPSLGEAPSGGAEAFWLLLRFSKVTRRQGGTLSSRYRSNGYVCGQKILAACQAAIASRLAPTFFSELFSGIAFTINPLWERACSRKWCAIKIDVG